MSLYYYVAAELAHQEDQAQARQRNLETRMSHHSFLISDNAFVSKYRLSKVLAQELIENLRPYMAPTLRSDALDVETKVLTFLRFVATGSYQALVGDSKHLSMCQASVSNVVHEVLEAINNPTVFTKFVSFPSTREERESTKRRFYAKYAMPGVVGCVDGTHVAIVRPTEHEERFYNRKGYHSLNVMIVCDSDLMILCGDPSYPGSTHDSVVWRNHQLNDHLSRLRATSGEDLYLLGDSGYPLRATLMTPILHAAPETPEAHYTEAHVMTRNVVERCIGVLKARFRCLLAARTLHYDPVTAAKVVNACSVLHNIAHGAKLWYPSLTPAEWEEEQILTRGASFVSDAPEPVTARGAELQQGQDVRRQLVARLWRDRV